MDEATDLLKECFLPKFEKSNLIMSRSYQRLRLLTLHAQQTHTADVALLYIPATFKRTGARFSANGASISSAIKFGISSYFTECNLSGILSKQSAAKEQWSEIG